MATLPSSSSRTSFCSRCREPCSSTRCPRCSSLGIEAKARLSAPASGLAASGPKQDRWASRYVAGNLALDDAAPSAQPSDSSIFKPSHQHRLSDMTGARSHRSSYGYGYSPAIGMPSSISRDLRNSISSSTSIGSPSDGSRPLKVDEAGPVVKESDGTLAKVFGTLVDGDSKPKWSCAGCRTIFARDATIYASPATGGNSPRTGDAAGSYFCKACYSSRFALGICANSSCAKPVLGSTKEDGKYVKAGEAVYHGRCWRCQGCERGGGPPPYGDGCEIIVGMDGKPTCEDCFGKPAKRKATAAATSNPAPTPAAGFRAQDVRRNSGLSAASRAGLGPQRNAAMGAAISELSKRFSSSTALNGPTASKPPMTWANDGGRPRGEGIGSVTPSGSGDMTRSNSGGTLSRSGSLSSSPGKPRPLIAQFTGESFNLAAFRSAQAGLVRSDSRSRSVSPAKRSPIAGSGGERERIPSAGSDDAEVDKKVAGTPSHEYSSDSTRIPSSAAWASRRTDPERGRTASGFPKPLNAPSEKEINGARSQQGEKRVGQDVDVESDGETRCAACGETPFDGPSAKAGKNEVTMITLRSGEMLHSECFVCRVCRKEIDASMTFSRLDEDDEDAPRQSRSVERYVHAACAPRAVLRRPTAPSGLSPSASLLNLTEAQQEHYHATQQRMPNRSRDPSPAPPPVVHSFVKSSAQVAEEERKGDVAQGTKPRGIVSSKPIGFGSSSRTSASSTTSTAPSAANRQFRGSIGVAVPTRSVLNVHSQRPNPSAGIFRSAGEERASPVAPAATPSPTTGRATAQPKFGGMLSCAGCSLSLSVLESVPGPRGTSWHKACLRCGGRKPSASPSYLGASAAKEQRCGKQLDTAAKVDRDGQIRCRECFDREYAKHAVAL